MMENKRYSTKYFENYPYSEYTMILDSRNGNKPVFKESFKNKDLANEVCEMLNRLDAELESAKWDAYHTEGN